MVRGFEVIEHLIDREFLERLNVGMYVLLRRLPRRCRIELGEEFLHVESLLADGDLDGIVTAAAVIEMEAIEKAFRIGMFFHDIRQRHIFRNHRIASFRGDCVLCLSRGDAQHFAHFLSHPQFVASCSAPLVRRARSSCYADGAEHSTPQMPASRRAPREHLQYSGRCRDASVTFGTARKRRHTKSRRPRPPSLSRRLLPSRFARLSLRRHSLAL